MPKFNSSFTRLKEAYSDLVEPEFMEEFADIYWRALIMLSCLAIVAILIYGALRLMDVQATLTTASSGESQSSSKDLDSDALQSAVDGFNARAQNFLSTAAGSSTIPDPSR